MTEEFNQKSGVDWHSVMMWGHALLMLGMLFPMVASAAPLGAATFGDMAVQGMHMVGDMFTGLLENMSVFGDAVANGMDGSWAPTTWDAGSMHGTEHLAGAHDAAAGIGAEHAAHGGTLASQSAGFDEWLQGMSGEELAAVKGEANSIYGMSLWDYYSQNHYHPPGL